MIVVAPPAVALAKISAMAMVPLEVASISNTPTGPFQMMVLAPIRMPANFATDCGPMSTASQSAGMPSFGTVFSAPTVRALKSSLSVTTKSSTQQPVQNMAVGHGARAAGHASLRRWVAPLCAKQGRSGLTTHPQARRHPLP